MTIARKRLHLLLECYACAPNKGSEWQLGWNLSYGMAKRGHEVDVITQPVSLEHISAAEGVGPPLPFNLRIHAANVPSWSRRIGGRNGELLRYTGWLHESYRVAKRLVASSQRSFDIAHHATFMSLQSGGYLWRLGIPFLHGPCGGGQVAPWRLLLSQRSAKLSETARTLGAQLMLLPGFRPSCVRRSTLLLATNTETLNAARTMGAKNILLHLDSAIPDTFLAAIQDRWLRKDKPKNTPIKVIWVGSLLPRKGILLAIRAFELAAKSCDMELHILGDGNDRPAVESAAQNNPRIVYHGSVPWSTVIHHYLCSDIMLFTSIRESFGSQLLEAAACGLPVVALNLHGVKDFLAECAVLGRADSPEISVSDLADGLILLARDEELRRRLGNKAREIALRYSWEHRLDAMEAYYYMTLELWGKSGRAAA